MKVITKGQAVSFQARKHAPGTSGIYALIDPRDGTPRYVGSTRHAEHRLYAHISCCERLDTPRGRWLAELKAAGIWPELWVLEEGDFGRTGSEARHEAEAKWIEICQDLFGGGDMNSRLVPSGHVNLRAAGKVSNTVEIRTLRAKIKSLEAELAPLRRLAMQHATKVQRDTVLQCCAASKSATQRNTTLRGVAVLH